MKLLKRFLPVLLLFMAVFVGSGADVRASASDENINVIVPVTVGITFNEDGSTTSTTFNVFNRSSVPIEITSVSATELNDWELVSSNTVIGKDTKQLSYILEGKEILAGRNEISIPVSEMGLHNFNMEIIRGAWTYSFDYEEAFLLEFEYEIVTKRFTLTLDGNGYLDSTTLSLQEGDEVWLPYPEDLEYQFIGWMDSNEKMYEEYYVMPDSNTTLTAMWRLPIYAIFSESDGSLTFVESLETIEAGQEYNGKKVTSVYSDFHTMRFVSHTHIPWYKDGTYKKVLSVQFEDYVFPYNTAYWFYGFENCMYFDVSKLHTFLTFDMSYMYYYAGRNGTGKNFVITGMEKWDTNRANNMYSMFAYSGENAETYHIGNIGFWDVSNVWNMSQMFSSTAMYANEIYIGDLSTWDTSGLESMGYMFCDMGWMATHINIGNIGTWDVSHVESMEYVFTNMGEFAETVVIGDLSQWDVSNVYSFDGMFQYMANSATDFYIGDLSSWNVSNAGMMNGMFYGAGQYSKTFYIGDLSRWSTDCVSEMEYMFCNTGQAATWSLDLSDWNVDNVCLRSSFNTGVETKVIPPIWKI